MNIWSSWLQGRGNAPEFIRKNFLLWERLNPDHSFHVIENKEAEEILDYLRIPQRDLSPQVITDLVRTFVLNKYGGAWVDSTLLPTMPISNWLTSELRSAGFFAFRSLGDPNLILQNWFLYADKNNPLIAGWLDIFGNYFQTLRRFPTIKRAIGNAHLVDYIRYKSAINRGDMLWFVDPNRGRDCIFYPYAVHNYNFAYMLKHSPDLQLIWNSVPRRMANLQFNISMIANDRDTPRDEFFHAASEVLWLSPVHKLTRHNPLFDNVVDMVNEQLFRNTVAS